jgi:hypothetical protein
MGESRTPLRVDRQLLALQLAKKCAALGARVRTISHLSGLPRRELLRQLFPDRSRVPKGRPPASPEWYHGANLLYRAEASTIMSIYRRLRGGGFTSAEALLAAYRHYRSIGEAPHRISLDRAFDLAAHTDGLWLTDQQSFSVLACPVCHSDFLAVYGSIPASNQPCPFCKLLQRYRTDQRVQASFPVRPLPDLAQVQLGARQLLRSTPARMEGPTTDRLRGMDVAAVQAPAPVATRA